MKRVIDVDDCASEAWACPACTFLNPSTADACQVCERRRAAPAAPAAPAGPAAPAAPGGCGEDLGKMKGASELPGQEEQMKKVLQLLVGAGSFRCGQQEVVRTLLQGEDVLYVFPTGAGKSLCYQLPALMANGKFGLVISPLIALMEDQVQGLRKRGIRAVALHSEMAASERKEALQSILPQRSGLEGFFAKAGKAPKLVYLSPELATSPNFADALRSWSSKIALVAVDEAHCVSKWGHDFRPCYRSLHRVRALLPSVPWAACTATATAKVREDVAQNLGLRGDPLREVLLPFDRQNLRYAVLPRRDGGFEDLFDLVAQQPESSCGIIYCQRKADCEHIAQQLQERGVSALPFHAGLCKAKKRTAFEAFLGRKTGEHPTDARPGASTRVLVATIAFGMGVDKADVRFVFHASPPKSLSAYYQESGRAGRDGAPALCVMLFTGKDFSSAKNLLTMTKGNAEIALAELEAVESFCLSTECRRRLLLQHFGDPNPSVQRSPASCCDRCAHCAGLALQGMERRPGHMEQVPTTTFRGPSRQPLAPVRLQAASQAFPGFMTAKELRGAKRRCLPF